MAGNLDMACLPWFVQRIRKESLSI